MNTKKFLRKFHAQTVITGLLGILFLFLLVAYIARGGYYPVALAHGDWISAREYWVDYDASLTYFKESGTIGRLSQSFDSEFRKEVARASLERLIEQALVKRGLNEILGQKTADRLVAAEIAAENLDDETLAEASSKLYGISGTQFVDLVAIPQARQDVLIAELAKSGKDFESWEKEIKTSARVSVFFSLFKWDGDSVVAKNAPAD